MREEKGTKGRDTQTIAMSICTGLGTMNTGMKKIDAEMFPACVEFALILEESHNEKMTKLKDQEQLNGNKK